MCGVSKYLGIVNSLHPAASLRSAVSLKAVGGDSGAELIEVDQQKGSCVPQLPADHVLKDQRLPNHLHFLHTLHWFSDQQYIREEETVHIHLRDIKKKK